MTARVKLVPGGRTFAVEGSDSLLDGALRCGLKLDYGCSNGNCGRCRARLVSGTLERVRRGDFCFRDAEKRAGHILLCCHTASGEVVLEAGEASHADDIPQQTLTARLRRLERLGSQVALLHVTTPRSQRLRFLAGQHATLRLRNAECIDLPIATCPCEDRNLQFHLPVNSRDGFTRALLSADDTPREIQIEGPKGAFIFDETSPRAAVFIAFATGFAAAKSLIEHAMAIDFRPAMRLYWIADGDSGHYLHNLPRSWADAFDEFLYFPLRVEGSGTAARTAASRLVADRIRADCPEPQARDFYLAGTAETVTTTAALLGELGVPRTQLHCQQWGHEC